MTFASRLMSMFGSPRLVFSTSWFRSAAWRGALIGVVCSLICWALGRTDVIRALENWAQDSSFVLRGRRASSADVVIVAMDEASLRELQKPLMFFSPELAEVVAYLNGRGAASIGVDFLLPNDDTTMEYLRSGGPGDAERMGIAVGQAGNVVLPQWLLEGDRPLEPPYEWYDRSLPSSLPWADLGFVDFTVDSDSCLRRQKLRIRDDLGNVYPSLALALLAKARGLSHDWLAAPELVLDGDPVPLDPDGCLTVNYVGPPRTIRMVPFREVLAAARTSKGINDAKDSSYRNAIVLIGATVGAFQDRYPTPYSNQTVFQWLRSDAAKPAEAQMSGVEVHANVLATLMDREYVTTPWFLAAPLLLGGVGAIIGAVLARCSLEIGALVALLHHIAWRGLAAGAFAWAHWRIEIVPMLLLGVMLYGTVFAMRWRWIRRMMGMVKSEAVARALEAVGAKLDLRGRQREITVFFCDIRDFTPFSERHSPQEVVGLLNAFFSVVVPAIEAEGGVVNQYIGDAVMVLFGAPKPQPDHALRAVRAAREVVSRVHQLHDRWKELGADPFRIGIGIHTGKAVVGTVGSPRRLDYTAIGDTVNTASRIESANKQLQSEALISQATFEALPEAEQQSIASSGGPQSLMLKGKQEALNVYSIR